MTAERHHPTYLKDYRPLDWQIKEVDLHFELDEESTLVRARLACAARDSQRGKSMVLAGRDLNLRSLRLDGRPLRGFEYQVDDEQLTILQPPPSFALEIETILQPQANTALEGLYRSSGNFCTQCEAEGFRRITYFLDRPDVLARYRTTLVADRRICPVLLANGNLVKSGDLDAGRHFAVWDDPYPKPSYLFALVAGDLVSIDDEFITASGRSILLQIYVQRHNAGRCSHAMQALKKAMRWDEEVFGLEYDLERYMIVAVDDFNMGAMENKGLNVFNSKYVLADPESATDEDFEGIDRVVAHEYFHNWTGNRVTCRDWFQLSLKEGLTVFRDQEFSADHTSRPLQRIRDAQDLRGRQFPEDAGPMAHPVRPSSYIEINNFYTVTVYEKGAELVRMIHTLIGGPAFRQGLRLYLERFDGQAVTTDDFLQAMAEAGDVDLTQFRRWYEQAGTPEVEVAPEYDAAAAALTLTLRQSCPPTPGQPHKEPFHIPFALGLLDRTGQDLPLRLKGEAEAGPKTRVLELRRQQQEFRFIDLPEKPVLSLLRNFSAPVKVRCAHEESTLRFLLAHDSDPFSRWEAGQLLACRLILKLAADFRSGRAFHFQADDALPYRLVMADERITDRTFISLLLSLPGEGYLGELMAVIDVEAIHEAREFVRRSLARELRPQLLAAYHENTDQGPYQYQTEAVGRRRLKNLCLNYLLSLGEEEIFTLALSQFQESTNMTDTLGALQPLVHHENPHRQEVIARFYRRWRHDSLVLDKWFTLQATAPLADTLEKVVDLLRHPAFSIRNPNRVRALVGAFCAGNPFCFHRSDGAGYRFLADQVLILNSLNPQIAARLLAPLCRWRRFAPDRGAMMQEQLLRILQSTTLSRDVYEVVSKSLHQ
jgi:aminopeptidase N